MLWEKVISIKDSSVIKMWVCPQGGSFFWKDGFENGKYPHEPANKEECIICTNEQTN